MKATEIGPRCHESLEKVQIQHGIVWSCSKCKGRAVGVGLLRKISKPELFEKLWA